MGDGSSSLPPGFRFFPSDEELVVHFLRRKAALLPCHPDIIPTLDLPCCDPWDLNGKALQGGNLSWYFFSSRSQSRATGSGYWQSARGDETITSNCVDVGVKKTFRYFLGEAPDGVKTNWSMHEYHLLDGGRGSSSASSNSSSSNGGRRKRGQQRATATESCNNKWIVCRVHESGGGSQSSFRDDGSDLSCLDEVFLSLDDDLDDISLPN